MVFYYLVVNSCLFTVVIDSFFKVVYYIAVLVVDSTFRGFGYFVLLFAVVVYVICLLFVVYCTGCVGV